MQESVTHDDKCARRHAQQVIPQSDDLTSIDGQERQIQVQFLVRSVRSLGVFLPKERIGPRAIAIDFLDNAGYFCDVGGDEPFDE